MPYREGDNGGKGSNIHKMVDLKSTGLRRYSRLGDKPKQKYGIFDKFLLAVILAFEADNNPNIFLTRANQHIK